MLSSKPVKPQPDPKPKKQTLSQCTILGTRNKSLKSKIDEYIREFGSESFVRDGTKLICRNCTTEIGPTKKQITQHLETMKHSKNRGLKKQKLLFESCATDTFNEELCEVIFISNRSSSIFVTYT